MNPAQQKVYDETVSKLRIAHGELLRMEKEGQINAERDNPARVGAYLTRLRLHAGLLFSFINNYLDLLNEGIKAVAAERQGYFEAQLKLGKSSSAAEVYAREMTRIKEADNKVVENQIQQIKNEFSRYDGIAISLQSRMREFSEERRSG